MNRSKPAIVFQSKDKELNINHEEEEEDENDYSVRNNWAIQLFSMAGDRGVSNVAGWLDLTSTFSKAALRSWGVVVVVAAVTGFYG